MTSLERATLETIAYFDVFDYPLTPMEIWKWLYVDREVDESLRQSTLGEVYEVLEHSDVLQERLGYHYGFYFLHGREAIVQTRMDRYRQAEFKYHRAKKLIRLFRFVPFVRMIGICNTLAYSNSRPEADIDLFIVTTPRRVWQARFWIAGILKLLNMRPTAEHTRDTLCASFFTDTEHLSLESLAMADDVYLRYWIAQVVPVFDEGSASRFLEDNRWIRQRLPHVIPIDPPRRRSVAPRRAIHRLIEAVALFLPERIFKQYQQRVMPARLTQLANQDTRVVVNDSMLKFHDTDRREQYRDAWRRRIAQFR